MFPVRMKVVLCVTEGSECELEWEWSSATFREECSVTASCPSLIISLFKSSDGSTGSNPYAIRAHTITITAFRAVDITHTNLHNIDRALIDILLQTAWHLVAEDMSSGTSNQELFFIA